MSDLEPLPPDLRALFAKEQKAYPENDAARARTMQRIETAIAFVAVAQTGAEAPPATAAGGGTVGTGMPSVMTAKTGLLASLLGPLARYGKLWFALAFAGGIAVGETHARLSAPPSPPDAGHATTATSGISGQRLDERQPSEPTSVPVASLPSASGALPKSAAEAAGGRGGTSIASVADAAPSNLAAEQTLIDTARAALSRGRGADALRTTADHARRFPHGRLAEERETLAIQALLLEERRDDAEARVRRFHESFPGSLYGNAVDALFAPRENGGR